MNVFKAMESPIAFFISQVIYKKCKRLLDVYEFLRFFTN